MDVDAEKLEQAVSRATVLEHVEQKSGKRAWKALPLERDGSTPRQGLHFRSGHESQVRVLSDEGLGCPKNCFEKLFAVK